ncbi:hypothetical protein EV715DRAFT_298026 [Schizophyllum commune]
MLENPGQLQERWSPPAEGDTCVLIACRGPSAPGLVFLFPALRGAMTAAQTTSPYPASRFARFNPFKTSSAKTSALPTPEPAYIPYNGPAEPPATLRAPALPDSQARYSWGDLKIDASRANTHSAAGEWGVLDADGAEVINIASEALAETRANQAAVAGEYATNYPPSSLHASNAAYQTTYVDSPAPSPSPSIESTHHFPPSP